MPMDCHHCKHATAQSAARRTLLLSCVNSLTNLSLHDGSTQYLRMQRKMLNDTASK